MFHESIFAFAEFAAAILVVSVVVFSFARIALLGEHAAKADGKPKTTTGDRSTAKTSERRRSERFARRIDVFAYSHTPGGNPFHQEAVTLEVSSHGGLLSLAANVFVGQKLLLTNIVSQDERECYVVRFTRQESQIREVAIAFTNPAADFWQKSSELPQEVS